MNYAELKRSLWKHSVTVPDYPELTEDLTADVCVVGAGIAGMSAAYELAHVGHTVIVVDDGVIGSGQTHYTTAHLASVQDDRFVRLEKVHGTEGSRLAAESHAAAIDRIESISAEEGIACDFHRLDAYLMPGKDQPTTELEEEMQAARRAGLSAEMVLKAPLVEGFDSGPSIRFANQAQFHAHKYILGLTKPIEARKGQIFCGTHATEIHGGKKPRVIMRNGCIVSCGAIILATNAPIVDNAQIYAKQAPYMSYVIVGAVKKGSVEKALYWDDEEPYHYVRLDLIGSEVERKEKDEDLLIIGGEDHRSGHADDANDRFARLERWARERFPLKKDLRYVWSGQVLEPMDGMGMIGRNPATDENVYIVTGDSGQGMTHGVLGGILLRDLILGRKNPWESLYEPSRFRLKASGEFLKENATVVADLTEWVTPGDGKEVQHLKRGTGMVVRRGASKVAIYRDDDGAVREFSAVCPHRGCIVRWNSFEKSWDCPCHGSRYKSDGTVINGPSLEDLKALS